MNRRLMKGEVGVHDLFIRMKKMSNAGGVRKRICCDTRSVDILSWKTNKEGFAINSPLNRIIL